MIDGIKHKRVESEDIMEKMFQMRYKNGDT